MINAVHYPGSHSARAHYLMQHEALPVYLDAYPLDISVDLGFCNIYVHHVSFDRSVVEWLEKSEVVEVARGSRSRIRIT